MGNIMKQHSILFTLFIPFTVLFILAFAIFMSYFIITESDKAITLNTSSREGEQTPKDYIIERLFPIF